MSALDTCERPRKDLRPLPRTRARCSLQTDNFRLGEYQQSLSTYHARYPIKHVDMPFVARLSTDAAIPKGSPSKNEPTMLVSAAPTILPSPVVFVTRGPKIPNVGRPKRPWQAWVVDTTLVATSQRNHQHSVWCWSSRATMKQRTYGPKEENNYGVHPRTSGPENEYTAQNDSITDNDLR